LATTAKQNPKAHRPTKTAKMIEKNSSSNAAEKLTES